MQISGAKQEKKWNSSGETKRFWDIPRCRNGQESELLRRNCRSWEVSFSCTLIRPKLAGLQLYKREKKQKRFVFYKVSEKKTFSPKQPAMLGTEIMWASQDFGVSFSSPSFRGFLLYPFLIKFFWEKY